MGAFNTAVKASKELWKKDLKKLSAVQLLPSLWRRIKNGVSIEMNKQRKYNV